MHEHDFRHSAVVSIEHSAVVSIYIEIHVKVQWHPCQRDVLAQFGTVMGCLAPVQPIENLILRLVRNCASCFATAVCVSGGSLFWPPKQKKRNLRYYGANREQSRHN